MQTVDAATGDGIMLAYRVAVGAAGAVADGTFFDGALAAGAFFAGSLVPGFGAEGSGFADGVAAAGRPGVDASLAESPLPPSPVARTAVSVTATAALAAVAMVSAGKERTPATTALRLAPGRNSGTASSSCIVSPDSDRTGRPGRTAFSKAPNPVMATFSPLLTSRVIVSTTELSALAAACLLPS